MDPTPPGWPWGPPPSLMADNTSGHSAVESPMVGRVGGDLGMGTRRSKYTSGCNGYVIWDLEGKGRDKGNGIGWLLPSLTDSYTMLRSRWGENQVWDWGVKARRLVDIRRCSFSPATLGQEKCWTSSAQRLDFIKKWRQVCVKIRA